jgi:uncharacterized membrane protein YkvA (DUF1232 family)
MGVLGSRLLGPDTGRGADVVTYGLASRVTVPPEQSWKPLLRNSRPTVTKVLNCEAFRVSRETAGLIIGDQDALRELALLVEAIDIAPTALVVLDDRLQAAVRFLRAKADRLEDPGGAVTDTATPATATRERLVVAALHYLVTPYDLVADFNPGGYVDDVLLLSWVFGAAVNELAPFTDSDDHLT